MPAVRPTLTWRSRRWLWLAAGAVLLGLWLSRSQLLGPLVTRVASGQLSAIIGGQVRIGQASGGWLRDARFEDVSLAAPGWDLRVRRIDASYSPGLLRGDTSAVRSLSLGGLDARIDLDAMPAPAGPRPWPAVLAQLPEELPRLDLDGDALLHLAGRDLRLAGMALAIADGRAELTVRQVVFDGHAYSLPPLRLSRPARETLRLAEPIALPFPGLRCDHLELTLGASVQQLVAAGSVAGGRWQARVTADEAALELQGVDVAALGLLPTVLGPVLVDGRIERSGDGWAIRSLRAAAAGLALDLAAQVEAGPWCCRDLIATVDADLARLLPGSQGRIHATLRGELPFPGWSAGRLHLAVAGTDLVLGGRACSTCRLEARLDAGVVRLLALDAAWDGWAVTLLEAPETIADAPAGPGWRLLPHPIGIAGGTATLSAHGDGSGGFAGELQLSGLQLSQLPVLTGLRHLQGAASGTFRCSGSPSAPAWSGDLLLEGVEAKLSADVPTITGGRARVAVEPGLLTVTELHGELGGAGFDASGRIRLDGSADAIDLVCRGGNLLLLQRPDARVRADLDLRLGGSPAMPQLAGEVVVVSALITPELQGGGGSGLGEDRIVLFELPDPPLSKTRFAVQMRSAAADGADRGVRVVTRWGRGTCDIDLRLGGTGAQPAPEGRVSVRDGVATLPFGTLKVTHGELVFPPGDPFQPRLTATAGARIRNYDVQAQVTGTLSQPVIRVTGSGLDEQEALMLLTTGSTPRELSDPQSQKAALGRVGVWLGQEAWRDLEGLDGVDDGPSLTERVVITWGRERSSQGRDTIDTEVELTRPGADPAVLLYGERDRYDQYNAGVILRLSWGGDEP